MLVAAMAAVVLLSTSSFALPAVTPSAINLQRGTTISSNPLPEVANSDNVYYTVTATKAHGTYAMRYTAIFDVPGAPSQMFLEWEGQANVSCVFKEALYNWATGHYVVGASGYITNTDVTLTQRAWPAKPFLKNHKVRARISCSNPDSVDLLTDQLRLVYS